MNLRIVAAVGFLGGAAVVTGVSLLLAPDDNARSQTQPAHAVIYRTDPSGSGAEQGADSSVAAEGSAHDAEGSVDLFMRDVLPGVAAGEATEGQGDDIWPQAAAFSSGCEPAPPFEDRGADFVERLLRENPDRFLYVFEHAREHHAQIIVSEVVRDAGGRQCIRSYGWNVDPALYFYPASAIKTVGAVGVLLSLQELNVAHGTSFDVDSRVTVEPRTATLATNDESVTITDGVSSTRLRHEIERTLVVSSNERFNTLMEIAGSEFLHRRLHAAGMTSLRLPNRLSMGAYWPETHRFSPRVWIGEGEGRIEWQPERELPLEDWQALSVDMPGTSVGERYFDDRLEETIEGPLDLSSKNYISLRDLERIVLEVVDPTLDGDETNIPLNDDNRRFLREIMASHPPAPDDGTVADAEARFKPLSPGVSSVLPREQYEYVNKAGRALGFHLDSAYIRNLQNDRAFFVSVALMVDTDGTMNDSRYDYEEISFPFFVNLGEMLARELLLDP